MRASENDFEGIQTTIPWVRDAKGQVDDWGVFVRVHTGRGQDTCISEQARRTRRTPTAGGVDGVKTVSRARARRTRRTPTASGIDGVKMVGRARGVKTVGRAGGDGTV